MTQATGDVTAIPVTDPSTRRAALGLAVSYHGLANHAKDAIPANPETVITTAQMFASYIAVGTIPAARQKRY